MSIRQALRQDAQFYRQLKFGEQAGGLRAWAVWITSTGLFLLATHRAANAFQKLRAAHQSPIKRAVLRLLLTMTRPLVLFRAKSDITGATYVAPGVYLSDGGQLVVGARSIGAGTIIHHAVTIGMSTMNQGTPQIGSNVWIGPDCVLYGNIEIGDGATLLPGTVLSKSIPPGSVVKGNPGRILEMGFDNSSLRRSLRWDVELAKLKSS